MSSLPGSPSEVKLRSDGFCSVCGEPLPSTAPNRFYCGSQTCQNKADKYFDSVRQAAQEKCLVES